MRKSLLLGLSALLAASFTACKDDVMSGPSYNQEEGESRGYVAFTIKTDLDTRALGDFTDDSFQHDDAPDENETFNPGTMNEYALSPNRMSHLALFFDGKDNFYSAEYLSLFDKSESNHEHKGDYGDSERLYTNVTKWTGSDADEPAKVLLILNMNPLRLEKIYNSIKNITQATAEGTATGSVTLPTVLQTVIDCESYDDPSYTAQVGMYKMGDVSYFTMTNSTFYAAEKNDAAENSTGAENDEVKKVSQTASKVVGNIKETEAEALANPITVYVERVVAKHSVYFDQDGKAIGDNGVMINPFDQKYAQYYGKVTPIEVKYVAQYPILDENGKIDQPDLGIPVSTQFKWGVYISNWGMNAIEPGTFIFKNMIASTTYNDEQPNDFFGTNHGSCWNNENLHRSYWAVDWHYQHGLNFTGNALYPLTRGGVHYYPVQYRNDAVDDETLSVVDDGKNKHKEGVTDTEETSLNYISYNKILNGGHYPHRYTLENTYEYQTGLEGYGPYSYATHVLLAAKLLFPDETGDFESTENVSHKYYAYGYYWADIKDYLNYSLFKLASEISVDGKLYTKDSDGKPKEIFVSEGKDYFTTNNAQVRHGDGKQSIVLNTGKDPIYYMVPNEGKLELSQMPLSNEDIAMNSSIEPVRHFNEGAMYYAIPIQHNQGHTIKEDDAVNFDKNGKYAMGDFGVVRNHWYRLNVRTIANVGIPVDDPDQPIIPDPEDDYYVAFEIVVLPWHIIDMGEIDL